MEEDILQQKRDNDRSCLVGVLEAFDCFQLVDNVHILDQEDHNLDGKLAVYRLELVLKEDNCYTPELPVEVRMVEVDLMVHQGHILVH
jgi:hypothetical protein